MVIAEAVPNTSIIEAGARHSKADQQILQTMHDHAVSLGAKCGAAEAPGESESTKEASNEAAMNAQHGSLKLVESAELLATIPLTEASRTSYPIRVITPGTGTTAHYTREVLRQEASKFKPGTLMFWNHPTAAEEAQRPEGNLDNLAAILTSAGRWEEEGARGPGIYAEAKVMSDYAEKISERAPHIGLSIRAGGKQDGTRTVNGKPLLKEFDYIESVDYVTKAGRGGLALAEAAEAMQVWSLSEADGPMMKCPECKGTGKVPMKEAAKPQSQQEVSDMDAAELTKLQESLAAQTVLNKKLLERAIRADAREEATRLLESVSLPPSSKARVITEVLAREIPTTDGALDSAKFAPLIEAAAKAEGVYVAGLIGSGRVTGMGAAPQPQLSVEESARIAAREKDETEAGIKVFESMGMSRAAAEKAFNGRAS